jgi:hypothetical protein
MPAKKYNDFEEGPEVQKLAKQQPPNSQVPLMRNYVPITCPHCTVVFVEIASDRITSNKASECRDHLKVCASDAAKSDHRRPLVITETKATPKAPKRKRVIDVSSVPSAKRGRGDGPSQVEEDAPKPAPEPPTDDDIVTIYALIFLPTAKRVYTGRTKDPDRRLNQHASRGSKCRLVRNAFRKHGRKSFALEPILRCRAADADANESYWIIQNQTLYPDGYNLRHGSKAGDADDGALDTALVPVCTGVVPFEGFADEAKACAEGWEDVAEIARDLDDSRNEVDEVCKDLLREVHPDAHGDEARTYTATEVAAMLNTVRGAVA